MLITGEPRALARVEHDFLLQEQLQGLQEHVLVERPLMNAAELAARFSAINIDLNSDGVPLITPYCMRNS